jgi:hypothetical protein
VDGEIVETGDVCFAPRPADVKPGDTPLIIVIGEEALTNCTEGAKPPRGRGFPVSDSRHRAAFMQEKRIISLGDVRYCTSKCSTNEC